MAKRRVVVTGLGMTTPVGNTVGEVWSNILKGKSGISLLQHFDTSGSGRPNQENCQVWHFCEYKTEAHSRYMSRSLA